MEENTTVEQASVSCKNSVMSRIRGEQICPHSKNFFRTREYAVWSLWAVSVVLGALAVAVMFFLASHRQYALYEATHENLLTFMVDALPYLWMTVFGMMVLVAVYNLRHTKSGYRYPLWQILGSSMVLSLAGGSVLHLIGMGYSVDHALGQQMRMYDSQEKMEARIWQSPEDGRLLGRIVGVTGAPQETTTFADISGKTWSIDVSDLTPQELDLLKQEDTVRLIGLYDEKTDLFHSCGAFPWLFDKHISRADLEATREAFVTKLHSYEEQIEMKIPHPGEDPEEKEEDIDENLCAEMKPVRRLKREGEERE